MCCIYVNYAFVLTLEVILLFMRYVSQLFIIKRKIKTTNFFVSFVNLSGHLNFLQTMEKYISFPLCIFLIWFLVILSLCLCKQNQYLIVFFAILM